MATEAPADARVLTAAEKRAARRARVLQGGESRLKLVTGQIASLKETERAASSAHEHDKLDKEMDSALNELLGATDGARAAGDCSEGDVAKAQPDQEHGQEQQGTDQDAGDASGLSARVALRPDPAQRRREAALRRQKKEAIVEQLLAPVQSASASTAAVSTTSASSASSASVASDAVMTAPKPGKAAAATPSRHALTLKLHAFEEKAIVLVLLAAAVYLGTSRAVRADCCRVWRGSLASLACLFCLSEAHW